MLKRIFIFLALWTATTTLHQPLAAQVSTPYSTSSVQGSTIITNYYDPNSSLNTGPGLPPSPLQNRFTGPLDTTSSFGQSTNTSAYGQAGTTSLYGQSATNSSLPPVQFLGQPQTTATQNPLGTLPAQQPVQPIYNTTTPQQQTYKPQNGPVILNPVGSTYTPQYASHYEDPTYPYPGLLTKMNGKWIGSEYLYDLPQNIGIVIEVIKPASKNIDVDTRGLRDAASLLFTKANIHPESLAIGDDPPLPFFHILIFVYPEDDRCTAAISGRLMEKVKLARLDFNTPGTSQAITWEKLDLIITSLLQFPDQLQEAVLEIVSTFINRVQYFADQKAKLNTGFRVQGCMQERVPQVTRMDCCDYNCR